MKVAKKEKILILTGNYGEGHVQVANALQEAIQIRFPTLESVIVDFMEWVHPYSNQVSRFLFLQGVKNFPEIYGYIYQKTRKMNTFSNMMKKFLSTGIGRMKTLIEEVQPTVVVSTFPLAAAVMSKLKSYGLSNVITVTTITDHTDHSSWIYPNTDQYLVGSKAVREALIKLGVEFDRITVSGIPIRQQFSQTFHREKICEKYGLDCYMPTVLVMGGGYGLIGDGGSTFQRFEEIPKQVQLFIVCGHNEKLQMKLREMLKNSKHLVHVTGYIHYVHEIMAISDVMITKPGGVTTFEAIAMKLPMLLYKPIPGQEQDNAKFLVRSGVAIEAQNERELTDLLTKLLCNVKLLQEMRENSKRFHPKEAAFALVEVIDAINRTKENQYPIKDFMYSLSY
ncbi:MGDG synthase family glycosyltransferase [Bacillus xiapuensis]|uniref:Glycosyltransferase n=1 Tax=Bacillus xiapuensis TaxID=2014075 RepID=A0ABU6NDM4_9BACI|nr:glycosyltransferase [Bacillus xiapuensis]